jgi:propionyl-CoA carboxylase alpha chain
VAAEGAAVFDKILVANRGEIACRVIRTARKMGIRTVAVYSDADRNALHVQLADEAVHIGASPSTQSYLLADRIIQACKDTGAQALHPGYGFLSENAGFCEALASAGIVFIGPRPRAIEAMGDKITSKKLAEEAGVNTIPGFADVLRDADHAVDIARKLGYPVMLKASAGGGGKGMRIARSDDECRDGFERAANEARSSFGDDRIFAEKFIEQPRHIEIQVLADQHGNVVHLNERECSLQRRHQKVVEESPSPFLDAETRQHMGEQAIALARAVDYQSAGTVEFIVDPERNFYFLEMNTRLQVEHPVTELTTGLDLVELMIRVAAGEALPISQDDVGIDGWAIETRVYAEDPFRNFLPSSGRLVHFQPPAERQGVRVDTGVFEGGEVSIFYDPMIAKLITHGADRTAAIDRMRSALDRFVIHGVSSNLAFLSALMANPRFISGEISTHTIAEEYPNGFSPRDLPHEDPVLIICVAAAVAHRHSNQAAQVHGQLSGHERRVPTDWVVLMDSGQHPVEVATANGACTVTYQGRTHTVETAWTPGARLFSGAIDGEPVHVQVERHNHVFRLSHGGSRSDVRILTPRAAELMQHIPEKAPADTSRHLHAPMPGLLISLSVTLGQEVKAGEELVVLEAMKMENTLRAERNGTVAKIHFEPGASVEVGDTLLEFE